MATTNKPAGKPAPAAAKTANKPAQAAARPAPAAARPTAPSAPKPAAPAPASPRGQAAQADVEELDRRATGTAVAQRQTTAVVGGADVPDHIRGGIGRGSEHVEMQDMVIPRIELVQALSKCLIEGDGAYIEGAKAGMFYNSVTRDLYGNRVLVCPVFFKKQYLNWRDRKKGGGFGGAHDSMQEAQDNIAARDNVDEWEAIETHQQIVLVVDPDTGETSEAVLSCARTKMKVSRQWNSLIRMNGFDRFSRIYELFGTDEQNPAGDKYKNIGVQYVDFANVPTFKAAEALYNSIASGVRAVKIDDEYIDGSMGAEDSAAPGAEAGGAESEY